MAKKFIRHLEFYGFPDQNTYESDINGCNVDLSELKEKDKEHDREIEELTDEKADKKSLNELSGTVDSIITLQTEINQGFAETISGNTEKINSITEKVNEIGDMLNDVVEDVQSLGERLENVETVSEQLSGEVETLSAKTDDIIGAIGELSEEVDGKLDKTEAEETYAKKDNVYTKDETDSKITEELEPYATKQWVEDSGFITQEQADDRYAKKETVNALSDRVNSAVTDLNTKIYTVSGSVAELSATTNTRFGILETNFETLRGEVNRKVNEISGTVNTLSAKVETNTSDIRNLDAVVDTKADKTDLEALQDTVSGLAEVVDTKVGEDEFNDYKEDVEDEFNRFDEKKADLSALTEAVNSIDELNDRLDQEIQDRISGDTNLQEQIDQLNNSFEDLEELVDGYDERIESLENGLAQEIIDRKQADLDLIGHETDDYEDNTIWGAKNFAKYQKNVAVDEANDYTDNKATEINNRIDQEHEWAEQNFSSAASKSFVSDMVNEMEDELETKINSKVDAEEERAMGAENDLLRRIIEILRAMGVTNSALDLLTNRVNAITAWDGTDPSEYDNTGNGVLDVLHREFHEFEETAGAIKEIRVEDYNLIIDYYTKDGEKEIVIPFYEIVDLSNYYNKQETDALLDEKVDNTEFNNLSEQVSANTENINLLDNGLEELINRLGYTNNDTLQKNGDHEVAFGEYNISNTSEEPSGKTIFSIGNGTDDANRSNAVEVRANGDVYMWVEGEFMNVNRLLAQIAHEVYDANGANNPHFFDGE